MNRPSKRSARALFAVVLVLAAGAVASSYATAETNVARGHGSPGAGGSAPGETGVAAPETRPPDYREPSENGSLTTGAVDEWSDGAASRADGRTLVDPAEHDPENLTVVGTQGFYASDEQAELVAFDRVGDVAYYDDSYRVYFDVDPVEGTDYTVEYLAAKHLDGEACANVSTERCTYNVFKRVNLTTGEEREVYGEVTPRIYSARWHDVDRINDTHVAVADILRDSVRVVNTTTDETVWEWNASSYFAPDVGGASGDWTHINDVEVTPDGRFMVSVRNMDRVVFVEPGEGVDANWTLGAEDDYDVLYEQHNPDYVPPAQGGPAVVVADSENSRVLEFQRVDPETGNVTTAADGEWRRSWGWRDSRLQWPRDADRLPGGDTLVVDTHGDRIAQIAPDGSVNWSLTVGMPYDVERLGTGDESAGGDSMRSIRDARGTTDAGSGARSGVGVPIVQPANDDADPDAVPPAGRITHPDRTVVETVWVGLKEVTPSIVVNGILYAAPSWVRFTDLAFGAVALVAALCWAGAELYWSRYAPLGRARAALRSVRPR
ncbi:aryl-sulfate sulfotransferase [Halosimplex aquaticum]|uniref:Aryl-sulfate sulfotransferase n=1 Tax=Halosimplex aquaticum TaxID=3026162 RepID=A0ABD5XY40_9EURY|nr:aryl-sulfate sulfotransferase [Halosimplex aquaticum]